MAAVAVRINGRDAAQLDVLDRGLHYGDGLFETMAARDGAVPLWPRHCERLLEGCARLGIAAVDPEQLREDVLALSRDCDRAVIKLMVTRGAGGRGYRPPADACSPTRIVLRYPWPDHPRRFWDEGVDVRLCSTRLASNPALAGIKHLNRLEQVLARSEWYDPEIAEGLMSDQHGRVIAGTQTNLFIVRNGRLLTPGLGECGVAGVMRGLILERAAGWGGVAAAEAVLDLADVQSADEVFLCNAVVGIWPVRRIESWIYASGPITGRLMAGLEAMSNGGAGTGQKAGA